MRNVLKMYRRFETMLRVALGSIAGGRGRPEFARLDSPEYTAAILRTQLIPILLDFSRVDKRDLEKTEPCLF